MLIKHPQPALRKKSADQYSRTRGFNALPTASQPCYQCSSHDPYGSLGGTICGRSLNMVPFFRLRHRSRTVSNGNESGLRRSVEKSYRHAHELLGYECVHDWCWNWFYISLSYLPGRLRREVVKKYPVVGLVWPTYWFGDCRSSDTASVVVAHPTTAWDFTDWPSICTLHPWYRPDDLQCIGNHLALLDWSIPRGKQWKTPEKIKPLLIRCSKISSICLRFFKLTA